MPQEPKSPEALILKSAFMSIAKGLAVGARELAILMEKPEDEIGSMIRELEAAGLLQTGQDQTIVGALGLSSVQTDHRLLVSGRVLYGWCCGDVIGIAAALGWNAEALSHCGHCGSSISVRLRRGEIEKIHPAAACCWLDEYTKDAQVYLPFCPRIICFCDRQHATRWREDYARTGGALIGLDEAARLGRQFWAWLGPYDPRSVESKVK